MCHVTKPMAALAMRGTLLRAAARKLVRLVGLFAVTAKTYLATHLKTLDDWRGSCLASTCLMGVCGPGARVTKLCVARCSG